LSEPYDLLEHHKLQDVLKGAREVLAIMTPEERAAVIAEAISKGVEVEVLVARAMGAIVRGFQLEEMARRDVQKEREKLPKVGW
jgi:sugar-specific transcriptional regulator TrmB